MHDKTKTIKSIAEKYNLSVPRYTSYPTAPRFTGMDKSTYLGAVKSLPDSATYSLYIHIPFCRQLCWYCGCQTKITKRTDLIEKYAYALCHEIDLMAKHLDQRRLNVSHIHFGGGTPNTLPADLFRKLFTHLKHNFNIVHGAEIAIEIDPRNLDDDDIITYIHKYIGKHTYTPHSRHTYRLFIVSNSHIWAEVIIFMHLHTHSYT